MIQVSKVLYTAKVHTTGGRAGRSVSDDGHLDAQLELPPGLGGKGGATNPEQLFAAGYSACFMGALKHVAGQQKIAVPADTWIEAEVDIGPVAVGSGFGLAVRLNVHLPGMDASAARNLVDTAHTVCPYSNATRGNIQVTLNVV